MVSDALVLAQLNKGALPEPGLHAGDLPEGWGGLIESSIIHGSKWLCLPALWQVRQTVAGGTATTDCV